MKRYGEVSLRLRCTLAVKAAERPKPKPKPPRHHRGLHGHQRRHRGYELIAYALCGHAYPHERALEPANRSWIHRLILGL
jgi:hypothetical protein